MFISLGNGKNIITEEIFNFQVDTVNQGCPNDGPRAKYSLPSSGYWSTSGLENISIWGHSISTHKSGPPSLLYAHVSLLLTPYPPLCTYSNPSSPLFISNENLFEYPIHDFIEKNIVKHLRDRKIVISNVF